MLVIAIDYDGTWDRAPDLWSQFVAKALAANHVVIVVTGRLDGPNSGKEVREAVGDLPIVFAGPRPKKAVAEEKGYTVDIWIDDSPCRVDNPLDSE